MTTKAPGDVGVWSIGFTAEHVAIAFRDLAALPWVMMLVGSSTLADARN